MPKMPKSLTWTLPRPAALSGTGNGDMRRDARHRLSPQRKMRRQPPPAATMAGMAPLIVLVHSPNLGPSTWQPVAAVLAAAGHQVIVPSLAGFAAGGPPYVPRLVGLIAGQAGAGARDDVVLVPHSGAGVFVPHLAAALAPGRVTAVFADASLPRQAAPGTVVEAEFLPFLRGLARDGTVPPWPRWWPDEDLSSLFP